MDVRRNCASEAEEEAMAKDLDPELAEYFERSEAEKQQRYEARVAGEILRYMGVSTVHCGVMKAAAAIEATPMSAFTPEYISESTHCPIIFRAIKDYHLGQQGGFPTPTMLLQKWVKGGKWRTVWSQVWQETLDRVGNSKKYAAACFRPSWSNSTVALHNYECILRTSGLEGGTLLHCASDGTLVIFSTLRDLVAGLMRTGWQPQGVL